MNRQFWAWMNAPDDEILEYLGLLPALVCTIYRTVSCTP